MKIALHSSSYSGLSDGASGSKMERVLHALSVVCRAVMDDCIVHGIKMKNSSQDMRDAVVAK
jgi:hypothetical protein